MKDRDFTENYDLLRHGYLTEYYVDDAEFIVKVPQGLKEVGVLLEPMTVVEKGIHQAYEIQRATGFHRPTGRRGEYFRHELFGLHRLVVVAHYLSEQAAAL
jgi:hypothetical protein